MTKILAISDVHGEENENLYKYLDNKLVLAMADPSNILALAYENIDYAETYPEPRIVIHFGDLIDDIELFEFI